MELEKLEKLVAIRDKAEAKKNKIDNLLQKYKKLQQIILDIKYLMGNAGEMIFTGRTGRLSEPEFLLMVRINDVGGCVAIPELMLQLADKRLKELEGELNGELQSK